MDRTEEWRAVVQLLSKHSVTSTGVEEYVEAELSPFAQLAQRTAVGITKEDKLIQTMDRLCVCMCMSVCMREYLYASSYVSHVSIHVCVGTQNSEKRVL
jgi:hypothetical protein